MKDIFIGHRICRCGGTGRRIRLKIVRETMWVRVPPSVPHNLVFVITGLYKLNIYGSISKLQLGIELFYYALSENNEAIVLAVLIFELESKCEYRLAVVFQLE